MKIIFLDVDGVLNSEHWYIKNHKRHPERCRTDTAIDPRFVRNLRKIVKRTGAKIVLSATCRGVVRKDRAHYLHQILSRYGLEIYDYTLRLGRERGHEIQDWLDKHKGVTNIVILDDDSDMCDYQLFNFVQTDTCDGITERDAKLCVDILNGIKILNPIRMNYELRFRWMLRCKYPEIENNIEELLENYKSKF